MNSHQAIAVPPPAGFVPLDIPGDFIRVNGPLYIRLPRPAAADAASVDAQDGLALGLRVEGRHGNPQGVCHGGMLMTFADMVLGLVVSHSEPGMGMLPTVSMNSDFLAPAPMGSFLVGTGRLLRRTRRMAFADGLVRADDRPVLRFNGILKIPGRPIAGAPGIIAGDPTAMRRDREPGMED